MDVATTANTCVQIMCHITANSSHLGIKWAAGSTRNSKLYD